MKNLSRIALLVPLLFLTACLKYGTGEQTGYVYAVDDGFFHSNVWIKNSINSSGNGDNYCVDDGTLKQQLKDLSPNQQIKIAYDRHFALASTCNNDMITSFTLIK
ncbi:MAG: hypothetical protein JWP89_2596 [Schlesneria sp.]|nr:hypothetical protein [Schlesneria sp.]